MMATPAHADRGRDHRLATRSAPTTRSSTSAARSLHVVRRLQRAVAGGLRRRLPRQEHPRLRLRPRHRRARRRRRLHLRRGDRAARLARGPPRPAAAAAAVPGRRRPLRQPDGGQQRRVDRVGARHRRATAPTGSRSMGTEKSHGLRRSTRCPGTSRDPGQYEAPLGHHAARAARPAPAACATGHELKFWTPGGSSTPMLTAEHLDVPLDFEARRRGRLDARHQGAADLRRDHLRGARGAALDRVLQARVLRQVHAVPRGHLLAGADPGAARAGQRHARRTSTCCSTAATTSSAARSARSATARPARSPRSIKYFRDEYVAHLDAAAAARSTRRASTLFAAELERPHDRRSPSRADAGAGSAGPGHADHRRRRGQRAQGHAGDPGRRADRHRRSRGSATTRCSTRSAPAGSAWSRSRRRQRPPMPKPQASCTIDGRRRHGGQDPAHLAGRRQGAAGRSWSSC